MDTRDRRPRPPASRDVLRENQRDGGLIPVFFPLFLFLCLSLSLPPSLPFLPLYILCSTEDLSDSSNHFIQTE